MKVTEIKARVSITANLGNFNSVKIELEETVVLNPDDPNEEYPSMIREKLFEHLKEEVYAQIQSIKGPKKGAA